VNAIAVGGAARTAKRSWVTIALPAPPPRSAQNRSARRPSAQRTTLPSASTTVAERRLSDVTP
jgi:hypothetical protein